MKDCLSSFNSKTIYVEYNTYGIERLFFASTRFKIFFCYTRCTMKVIELQILLHEKYNFLYLTNLSANGNVLDVNSATISKFFHASVGNN